MLNKMPNLPKMVYNDIESTYESDSDEDEIKDMNKAKFLHPFEVQEHIKHLWEENDDILTVMFGNIDFSGKVISKGYDIFFMKTILVTPNRFRPETAGGWAGSESVDTRQFLHSHSAMLTRILRAIANF